MICIHMVDGFDILRGGARGSHDWQMEKRGKKKEDSIRTGPCELERESRNAERDFEKPGNKRE